MEFILALFGCSLIFFSGMIVADEDFNWGHAVGIVILIIIGDALIAGAIEYVRSDREKEEPNAIDVYRNKTTLQITYKDSIPVDTLVVFK